MRTSLPLTVAGAGTRHEGEAEAVASGITEFETEFLGNIVMPGTSVTVGEYVKHDLQFAYEQKETLPLLPARVR